MQYINIIKETLRIDGHPALSEILAEKPQGECSDFYCRVCGITRRILVEENDTAGRDAARAAFITEHENC